MPKVFYETIMWKPPPRAAQTTIPCPCCKKPLIAGRDCHEAYLRCDDCGKTYAIKECLKDMDEALEAFLETVNCARV
jgi:transposase-like protein